MALTTTEMVISGPQALKRGRPRKTNCSQVSSIDLAPSTLPHQSMAPDFYKFLTALSKIGEKLNLDPKPDRLKMSAVNSSHSAFVLFHLLPRFFERYEVPETANAPCVSLNVKSLLAIFKSKTLEKNVSRCVIQIQAQGVEADRIVVQVQCTNGVLKTHKLHYEAVQAIQAVYLKSGCPHKITGSSRFVKDFFNNFHSRLEEVTLDCGPDFIKLTSYKAWSADMDVIKRGLKTELVLAPTDFLEFNVTSATNLTINFKELKSVLAFSDGVDQPVTMHFDRSGAPMILTVMEDNVYVADFVMATIIPDEADADMDDENDAPAPSNGHAPQPSNAPRASNAQSTAPRTRAAAPAATASRIQGQAAAAPNANGNRATNGASAARPSGAVQATVSQGNFGASARNSHAPSQDGNAGPSGGFMMSRAAQPPTTGYEGASNFMPQIGNSMAAPGFGGAVYRMASAPQPAPEPRYWEQDFDRGDDDGEDEEELPPTPPRRRGGGLLF